MRHNWCVRVVVVFTLLSCISASFIVAKVHTDLEREFYRNFIGYHSLEQSEYDQLLSQHREIPIALKTEVRQGKLLLSFSLPVDSAVYLTASADSARTVFVHPLILEREDGKKFLLPLLRSDVVGEELSSSIRLGHFSAGVHQVELTQDDSVNLSLPSTLQLQASRSAYQSPLSVFIDHHPVVEVRNPRNVLDDIPLIGYSRIYKRGDDYMVTSNLIFSSENGGTKPPVLMRSYGRTLDVEWVMKQIFAHDGDALQPSYRQYQGGSHTPRQFEGKQYLDSSPVLEVATLNNNFSDGRFWLDGIIPRRASANTEVLYYAPKPEFLPPGKIPEEVFDGFDDMQRWSQYEVAMENCVDLSDLSDPEVAKFIAELDWIRQHLEVSYRDRDCGNKPMRLPHSTSAETILLSNAWVPPGHWAVIHTPIITFQSLV